MFHTSIFWAADVGSRIVDIVHLTSPANENNQVFRQRLKEKFWSGIVVDWTDVESYIQEDDCALIGPGMVRGNQTSLIVNSLLRKYPTKRWVIDGGGLQEVEPGLIAASCILTPHKKEFLNLADKSYKNYKDYNLANLSKKLDSCAILLKGPVDAVCRGNHCVEISGGNPGMTKGGTGDCLAGLVAALYCKNDAWVAATVASWVNKTAGDNLYARVGPYFNAADLVEEVPKVLFSSFC